MPSIDKYLQAPWMAISSNKGENNANIAHQNYYNTMEAAFPYGAVHRAHAHKHGSLCLSKKAMQGRLE